MVTFHSNVDDDFDRIYDYLRDERGLAEDEVSAIVDAIYEDAEDSGKPPVGRYKGLTFHRGRNGYFIWFEMSVGEVQIYAVYHRREEYDKVIHGRAAKAS